MFRLSKLNLLYILGTLVLTFLAFGYAYSKWYDDLFHWYIDKTTPRSFNLYANIECDDRIETERVAFHFFGGTQADDVFIKINKSYYVPLYGKNPMDSRYYPAPAWWYSIWVDELPASGTVYIRTSTNELLQFPFEATQQTAVVHVTRESNDVYRVEIREERYVM